MIWFTKCVRLNQFFVNTKKKGFKSRKGNFFLVTGTLLVVRSLNESNQDETEKFLIYFSVVVAVCALCVVVTLTGLIWAIQKKSNSEENLKENFTSHLETE